MILFSVVTTIISMVMIAAATLSANEGPVAEKSRCRFSPSVAGQERQVMRHEDPGSGQQAAHGWCRACSQAGPDEMIGPAMIFRILKGCPRVSVLAATTSVTLR